jgi:RHS repeat-associated protein
LGDRQALIVMAYYRGEQYDPDLGLYYLRARYYNPTTGRFLSVDSLAGQGQRRYEYAAADPVNGEDPSGDFVLESYWPLCCARGEPIPDPSVSFQWCFRVADILIGNFLPPCKTHWTVRINYRSILKFKFGSNCNSIPGCHLPLRFVRHSYVEIDAPDDAPIDLRGKHTWGVLGSDKTGKDQEMFKDHLNWDQDPVSDTAGVTSNVVQVPDWEAQDFEQVLNLRAAESYPNCPSCGIGIYHNGPLPPIDVVSFFNAYNSNTFTWNVIANFLQVTPDPISRAPGYHYSAGYQGYP